MIDLTAIDVPFIIDDAWAEATNGCLSTALKEHDDRFHEGAIDV